MALPKAQQPKDRFFQPVLKLDDLPRLEDVLLDGAPIDAALVRTLRDLPSLESLEILCDGNDSAMVFSSGKSLRRLFVSEGLGSNIAVHDMPQLQRLILGSSATTDGLKALRDMPHLAELTLSRSLCNTDDGEMAAIQTAHPGLVIRDEYGVFNPNTTVPAAPPWLGTQ